MYSSLNWLQPILNRERLPLGFEGVVREHFVPIAAQIASWHGEGALVIGINGAQGTGKSTLSVILAAALQENFGKKTVVMSIDDIYHTRGRRQKLAEEVHPLLMTRGVPGTHDVQLGFEVIKQLKSEDFPVAIPSFSKSIDDRRPHSDWPVVHKKPDIIIFEGWCIGAIPQDNASLIKAVNELEEKEDAQCIWRQYVNERLQKSYQLLFGLIDKLIMIKAPSFDCVYHWRSEQEDKLRHQTADLGGQCGLMNQDELVRFIRHYERLTQWMFEEMPARSDILIELNRDHSIQQTSGITKL